MYIYIYICIFFVCTNGYYETLSNFVKLRKPEVLEMQKTRQIFSSIFLLKLLCWNQWTFPTRKEVISFSVSFPWGAKEVTNSHPSQRISAKGLDTSGEIWPRSLTWDFSGNKNCWRAQLGAEINMDRSGSVYPCTLPETNSKSTWKWMVGILIAVLLGWPIFRGYVSFREGIFSWFVASSTKYTQVVSQSGGASDLFLFTKTTTAVFYIRFLDRNRHRMAIISKGVQFHVSVF